MAVLLRHSVGSLCYSTRDLYRVIGCLLAMWFVYSLFTTAFAGAMPLVLEQNGASNSEIIFITVVLASIINMFLNPVVSYASDFTRSRHGRRRPYIFLAAPVVAFFFILVAFADDISSLLAENSMFRSLAGLFGFSPPTMVFVLIAVGYYLSFGFINTVTFYLIPDVIPRTVMARYNGLMRIANSTGGAVFNYFFLQYVLTHGKIVIPAVAIVFAAVTMITAWKIKEGDYPPPPRRSDSDNYLVKFLDSARDYFSCSFGSRYCWLILITYACANVSLSLNSLMVFFCRDEIGMTVREFGQVNAWMFIFVLLILPLSLLLDRMNHFRVFFYSWLATGLISLLGFFIVHGYWSYFAVTLLLTLAGLPNSIDGTKVSIDLFPPSRYGQFCSARAMFNSICAIIFGMIGGKLLDCLGRFTPADGQDPGVLYSLFGHYRILYLWRGAFMVAAALLFWRLYRYWLSNRRYRKKMRRS